MTLPSTAGMSLFRMVHPVQAARLAKLSCAACTEEPASRQVQAAALAIVMPLKQNHSSAAA
jgi:hypothetical protein